VAARVKLVPFPLVPESVRHEWNSCPSRSCRDQKFLRSQLKETAEGGCPYVRSFTLIPVNAEIIAVGSELLTPHRQDTNSLYLTEKLNDLGAEVRFKCIVGDDLEGLTAAARLAMRRSDIIIFTGGLGPTEDDVTRESVAEALGLKLQRDPAILARLEERFVKRGMKMSANNAKQADVLTSATLLPNPVGSA